MKYQVGQRITGTINNVTDLGIFVTLDKRTSGLIHHNDFGKNWLREKHNYVVGDLLRVVVLHNHAGKLSLSCKRVNDINLRDPLNQFNKTPADKFLPVLEGVLDSAQKERAHLEKVLVNERNQ